jgi:uncharacterized SAM-binding protein YcdF (DUF218 family)
MLSLLACPESTAGSWLSFTRFASRWITQPSEVMLAFIGLFWLVSLLPKRWGRRPARITVVGLALSYLLALSPLFINIAGKVLESPIPDDSGMAAEAIVVLGRGNGYNPSRITVVRKLWEEERAPLIFASGISDAPRILGSLQRQGIPEQSLQGEECSRTTYENAKFTALLLKPQGVKRILLVTDSPHMMRSLLTFRGFGFSVTPVISSGLRGLNRSSKTFTVLREWVGLVSYGLMGRYSRQPNPEMAFFPLPPQHPSSSGAAESVRII